MLLTSLVEALTFQIGRDPELQAACASLQRLGLSPLVRVELVASSDGPRVVAGGRRGAVSEWSEKDAEVLRSVGIASEGSESADVQSVPPQPRRRQPR